MFRDFRVGDARLLLTRSLIVLLAGGDDKDREGEVEGVDDILFLFLFSGFSYKC